MATSLRSVFFAVRMDGEIDTQLFAAMTRVAAGQKADYITMKWKPLKPGIGELMTGQGIIEVIDGLVGPVEATGDSREDYMRLAHLEKLIEVTDWCIENLISASNAISRFEYSMFQIGKTANDALVEIERTLQEGRM